MGVCCINSVTFVNGVEGATRIVRSIRFNLLSNYVSVVFPNRVLNRIK